jgi:hypothetical protein
MLHNFRFFSIRYNGVSSFITDKSGYLTDKKVDKMLQIELEILFSLIPSLPSKNKSKLDSGQHLPSSIQPFAFSLDKR